MNSSKNDIFAAMRSDPRRATRQLTALAGQGDADAIFLIGLRKWDGRTRSGQEDAYRYFKKAASLGHAYARLHLAHAKMEGCGTPRNRVVALRWLEQAAEEGCAAAMDTLAEHKLEDDPAGCDPQQGLEWLRRAAAQNHGTPAISIRPLKDYESYTDYIDAREGFRILRAKEHLAFLYEAGDYGLQRDPGAAAALLEPVYRAGVGEHAWTLHELYEQAAQPQEARRILEELARAGDGRARQMLGQLAPAPDGTVTDLAALLAHGSEEDKLRYARARLERDDPRGCIRILERPELLWYASAEELRARLKKELGAAAYLDYAIPKEEAKRLAVLSAVRDL
jgi:TPR repeat protein